jgi:hypothetical protein
VAPKTETKTKSRARSMRNGKRWAGPDSAVCKAVETFSRQTLAAYREAPRFVEEHTNLELSAIEGGYGRRQLFELVQNGADELLDSSGRIHVRLTDDALYCANEGKPLTVEGADYQRAG